MGMQNLSNYMYARQMKYEHQAFASPDVHDIAHENFTHWILSETVGVRLEQPTYHTIKDTELTVKDTDSNLETERVLFGQSVDLDFIQ